MNDIEIKLIAIHFMFQMHKINTNNERIHHNKRMVDTKR